MDRAYRPASAGFRKASFGIGDVLSQLSLDELGDKRGFRPKPVALMVGSSKAQWRAVGGAVTPSGW